MRQSSRSRSSSSRPRTGGCPVRSASSSSLGRPLRRAERDDRGGQLDGGQGPAADLGARLGDARPEGPGRRGADAGEDSPGAAANRRERLGEHAQGGDRLERGPRLVGVERGLERGDRELVDAQGPVQRVAREALHQLGPPDHDPGLRPPQELVARERHEVHAGGDHLGHGGLVGEAVAGEVHEAARAEVLHHRDAARPAELGELPRGDRGGEADHAVVRGVDLEDQAGLGADGVDVVLADACGWWCPPRAAPRRCVAGCRGSGTRRRSR